MPRAPREFELSVPETQSEMLRTPRQIELEIPQYQANANFECRFCFCEFLIPEDKDADLCSQVWNHIWQCHREQWEGSKGWTKRIYRRKARPDLLTETS